MNIIFLANQDRGLIGVSLAYILTLCGMFQWTVRQSAEVDNLVSYTPCNHKNTFFLTKWENYDNQKSIQVIECQQQKYIHPQLRFETSITLPSTT